MNAIALCFSSASPTACQDSDRPRVRGEPLGLLVLPAGYGDHAGHRHCPLTRGSTAGWFRCSFKSRKIAGSASANRRPPNVLIRSAAFSGGSRLNLPGQRRGRRGAWPAPGKSPRPSPGDFAPRALFSGAPAAVWATSSCHGARRGRVAGRRDRRLGRRQAEVPQDRFDHGALGDEGDHPSPATAGTGEHILAEDALEQLTEYSRGSGRRGRCLLTT